MIALRSWVVCCAWLGLTAPILAVICPDPPLLEIDDLVESRFGSPDLTPPNNAEAFGGPIAIHGDWMVVGARRDDQDQTNNFDSGAAYVYERENGLWVFRQKLLSDDGVGNTTKCDHTAHWATGRRHQKRSSGPQGPLEEKRPL